MSCTIGLSTTFILRQSVDLGLFSTYPPSPPTFISLSLFHDRHSVRLQCAVIFSSYDLSVLPSFETRHLGNTSTCSNHPVLPLNTTTTQYPSTVFEPIIHQASSTLSYLFDLPTTSPENRRETEKHSRRVPCTTKTTHTFTHRVINTLTVICLPTTRRPILHTEEIETHRH